MVLINDNKIFEILFYLDKPLHKVGLL